MAITMGKEAYDDYQRYLRDREANSARYLLVLPAPALNPFPADSPDPAAFPASAAQGKPMTRATPSSSLKVGDLVLLEKNQRVPADMVLLATSEDEGTCFIRTDQLDGETDWKLRVAPGETQSLGEAGIGNLEGSLYGMSVSHTPVLKA
jgi:phospholipid-translocating ATPase